jgi:lysine 2,3-aminomutase
MIGLVGTTLGEAGVNIDDMDDGVRPVHTALLRAGIPVNNQSVLLRGVNDSVDVMRELVHGLLRIKVRPYYLYHCDDVVGAAHLRTSVRKGLQIMASLRGHTTGYAVPEYVIDAPGGGGKVPVTPDYVLSHNADRVVIRNYEGKVFEYPEACGEPRLTAHC